MLIKFRRLFVLFIVSVFFILPLQTYADVLGQQEQFSISTTYDFKGRTQIGASLQYISPHAYFYVEDNYWSAINPEFRQQIKDQTKIIADEFENRIYSSERQFFGSEPNPGIDGDQHITIMLTPLVDYAGGYYDTGNEYPKTLQPTSNQREMIYLNVSTLFDTRRVYGFLAHEFQHMISFQQKEVIAKVEDDIWINELRSEYAVDLLGYNEPYLKSNFERRVSSFLENPSDSLTEWKNITADYGQITLFGKYLAERTSPKVVADTAHTLDAGISSVNTSLTNNSFKTNFSDMFISWMIANFLNNQSIRPEFGYTDPDLKNIHVSATNTFPLIGDSSKIIASGMFKDWEQHWYDLPTFTQGLNSVLKIKFTSPSATSFLVPFIVFYNDNTTKVFLFSPTTTEDSLYVDGVGDSVKRIVVMPFTRDRFSGFTMNEKSVSLTLTLERILPSQKPATSTVKIFGEQPTPAPGLPFRPKPADYGLHEGDFIRAEGDNDIFIINDYGYKRLVLNPSICLLYGHLGARGCFGAVHVVTTQVRDAFQTSYFFTNGETKDGIVYKMQLIDDDHAKLLKFADSFVMFTSQQLDANSIFFINTKEQNSY